MKLRQYLTRYGITQEQFAKKIEVSRNYVNMLCRADFRPSVHLARVIVTATGGNVTFSELRELPPKKNKKPKEANDGTL